MPLKEDDVLEEIKRSIGEQAVDQTETLRDYLKNTVMHISKNFFRGPVERLSKDITVASNQFSVPSDFKRAKLVYYTGPIKFRIVDAREFVMAEIDSSGEPMVYFDKDKDGYTGFMLNNESASTKVNLLYERRTDDIGILELEHKELAIMGVKKRYSLDFLSKDEFVFYRDEYKRMMDEFSAESVYNLDSDDLRMQSPLATELESN